MRYTFNFLLLLFLFSLGACTFNKRFFQPGKISGEPTNKFSFTVGETRTYVEMDTSDLQPLRIEENGEELNFNSKVISKRFRSRNGNQLNGWFLQKEGNKPRYTVLHLHGSGQFIYTQYKNILPLVDEGFQCFTFDYSGYGFSEGEANRENALADVHGALDYLLTSPEAEDTDFILYGQSLGGYLAALVSAERQEDIAGLVIEGAYTSPKDIATYSSPLWGKLLVKDGPSALLAIRKNEKPVLIIHSTEDKVVPFEMGQELFEAANEPKNILKLDKPHIAALHFYAPEIAEKMLEMLK